MSKAVVTWTLFGVGFLINPNLGCSSSDDEREFSYSEQDMRLAVLGDWRGVAELDGQSFEFDLTLEQASSKSTTQAVVPPPPRPQCASRSFVKPAGACVSISSMELIGRITSTNPNLAGSVRGEATAFRNLEPTELHLEVEGGPVLTGRVEAHSLTQGELFGTQEGSFQLSRHALD